VATECFFECGPRMREQHPELYAILQEFYRQDTAAWTQQVANADAKRA
jgi:Mlc titration factor MtfA (ptsG expression regulator)